MCTFIYMCFYIYIYIYIWIYVHVNACIHAYTYSNTLTYVHAHSAGATVMFPSSTMFSFIVIVHCNTLQHTATHCNTLQHTATHCSALLSLYKLNCAASGHIENFCRILQVLQACFLHASIYMYVYPKEYIHAYTYSNTLTYIHTYFAGATVMLPARKYARGASRSARARGDEFSKVSSIVILHCTSSSKLTFQKFVYEGGAARRVHARVVRNSEKLAHYSIWYVQWL